MADDLKSTNSLLTGRSPAFTLQHLRYAISAADHGSFRRAADALLLRQSTLSRRIRQLEDSVGMVVFERSSGGVSATTSGREFLRVARSILEQLDALLATTHSAGRGEAGQLAIGFYTSLSAGNFRASLMDFRQRFPQIEIEMIEKSRRRLVTALRNGVVDIAIVTGAAPLPECLSVSLWSERIMVALLENHPLAKKELIYWTDLKAERVLLSRRDPGPELEDLITAKLASPVDRPRIFFHDVSRGSLWNLVGAGFGITLLTEATVGTNFVGVVYKDIRDTTEPTRIGYSAHWRADNENPALASFLKILSERYPLPTIGA
ncbi:LysR family transcriptional regulator [Methylocapsa sp. S129]|uniref:LysR family transcriptional regulator n=1 Tax=Methylocapsa sp. S129 TaxID=1641869 RepID=UPI00131DA5FC|nr:LysR family transcriptional regulator [Methylocapsa sp. S129]